MLSLIYSLSLATVGGLIASYFGLPLAWMIGPLLFVGIATMTGASLNAPQGGRQVGQATVGVAVGLQMTPDVVAFLLQEIWLIVSAGLATILLGIPMALLLRRLSGEDTATCYFSAVPGGLSEMAILGQRFGAQIEPIAIAQTMRLALIVLTIPPLLAYSGITGDALSGPAGAAIASPWLTMALVAVGVVVSRTLSCLRVSNAWILGGILTGSSIAIVSGQVLALPWLALNGAQFLLGLGLGIMFRREFVTRAPRFMRAAALMVLVMIVLAAICAYAVAQMTDHGFGTLMLSFAPAGVTEMMLTAKALGFEAPLITAIHLTRILLIVLMTAGLFRLFFRPGQPE
jgi:hypothetical protein